MVQRTRHNKAPSVSLTTLLVVGEGADDKAFINHMKALFHQRQIGKVGPKIEAGNGGSADVIITNTLRMFKTAAYDRKLLVLDSDLPPTAAKAKAANKAGFELILWSPLCLEGALLNVLGEAINPNETSQQLKKRLHPRLATGHTQSEAYAQLFPRTVLEHTANLSVTAVRQAITNS